MNEIETCYDKQTFTQMEHEARKHIYIFYSHNVVG